VQPPNSQTRSSHPIASAIGSPTESEHRRTDRFTSPAEVVEEEVAKEEVAEEEAAKEER
jgi:hypothetical protein